MDEKYILNPYLKIVICSEDEIIVRHGMRSRFSEIITDEEKRKLVGKIVRFFKEEGSIKDLIVQKNITEDKKRDVESIVNLFCQKEILIKSSEDINELYLKSILKGERRLSERKIGVIGCGFLGQRMIKHLLKLGIKNLTIYDERKVRNFNLENRFFDFDIDSSLTKENMSYVELVRDYFSSKGYNGIKGINGLFDDGENITKVFQEVDFIIVPFEFFASRNFHFINKIAIQTEKPWISVYIDGSQGVIGPLYIPGETSCYNEFELQLESAIKLKDEYILYKDFLDEEGNNFFHPVIPPYLEIISNFTIIFVLQFLIKKASCAIGRVIFINFEDMSIDYQEIMKIPRCPVCAEGRSIYKHSFV